MLLRNWKRDTNCGCRGDAPILTPATWGQCNAFVCANTWAFLKPGIASLPMCFERGLVCCPGSTGENCLYWKWAEIRGFLSREAANRLPQMELEV